MFVDYSQLQPIAVMDQLTGLWLKTQVTPLFGPLVLFSQTFPASGILHGGKLYAPLMQGQPITGLGFSSLPSQQTELLRTPISSEAEGGAMHPDDAKAGGNNLKLGWQILGHFGHIDPKLPTPAVAHVRNHDEDLDDYMQRRQDYVDGKVKGMPGASLGVAVRLTAEGIDWKEPTLLPTPMARDFKGDTNPHERDGVVQTDTIERAIFHSGEVLIGTPRTSSANGSTSKQVANGASKSRIEDQVLLTDWGKFAPAIERWEAVIDREAPAPTKPDGKDGQHRLSAEFTEWMMGLPAGWVTDPELDLTRNEQLKLCGNGVVPQQAALALTRLLTGINLNKEEQK